MFFGVVLVNGCPERSSSSTDVRPSLKRLYHKKVLLLQSTSQFHFATQLDSFPPAKSFSLS
jgi:hypothetical protein